MPRVFISYGRESEAHAERVLALADRLRAEGVDARLDQDGSEEDMPRWLRPFVHHRSWTGYDDLYRLHRDDHQSEAPPAPSARPSPNTRWHPVANPLATLVVFSQLPLALTPSSSTDGPMPSVPHEMLVELLARSPQLLPPLLGDRLDALSDLSDLHPAATLRPADLCIRCGQSTATQLPVLFADLGLELHLPTSPDPRRPTTALTVEIQLSLDDDKPYSWIPYLGAQYHRLHVPAYLLVVTNDPVIAAWAAGPFRAGHLTLTPWVLGPDDVPAITTLDDARKSLDMALFSGIAHGREPIAVPIGLVLRQALDEAPDDVGLYYWDAFLASLTDPVRKELDMLLPTFQPRSDWSKAIFAKGLAEGQAKGLAEGAAKGLAEGQAEGEVRGERLGRAKARVEDILFLLAARGFSLDAKLRRRITRCSNLATLDFWFRKAATADSLDAVFAPEPRPRLGSTPSPRRSPSAVRNHERSRA